MDRETELEQLLATYRKEYYVNHNPIVSDDVYDALRDELIDLKSDSPEIAAVGAAEPPSEWVKVAHEIPMGSLEKINTLEELTGWVNKVSTGTTPFEELLVTEKLDGISIAIQYENGAFVRAVTRGDGIEGNDISVNVVKMKGVPGRLPKKFTGQVRGEILVTLSDLSKYFPGYSNPRNTASGISSRLDGEGCQYLTVMIYHVAEGLDNVEKRSEHIEFLQKMGFKTPNWYVTAMAPGVKTPHDLWVEYQQSRRESLDYAIDGLVVEMNYITRQQALGESNGRPHGARAFKFAPISRQTVLRSIENETAGTGRICPVAIFDEVNLLGTKVTRASLYNWAYVRNLKLDVGCKILVARAGDVIPRVVESVTSMGTIAQPPTTCSSCGSETEMSGEYLVCTNTSDCPAQALGRLVRYVKSLDILEWGEAVMTRLVESGLVKDVSDLYKLTQKELAAVDRMGIKSAKKLLDTLNAKQPIPIEMFFGSLSIPGCGKTIMSMIVDAGYDTVDKLTSVTYDQLLAISGMGPVRAKVLTDWFAKHTEWALSIDVKLKERTKGGLTGKSFCFTGKSKNKRAVLEEYVRNAGGSVKGSVGKGLSYLVLADPNSGSTKAEAARKNGTLTISEEEFLEMAGA